MRATRAVIHLDYFKENILNIKKFIAPNVKMCIPVKADAYGHGSIECARAALECGADFLSVATVDEGAELRKAGIKAPILLFSLASPEESSDLVKNDLTPFVFDSEYIEMIAKEAKKVNKEKYPVHLAVDTGMGRIGCNEDEAVFLAEEIVKNPYLSLGGMATHFSSSDTKDEESIEYTKKQFKIFLKAIKNVKSKGIEPGICHAAASAATLDLEESHLDMVRPGIIVYGYYADDVNKEYLEKKGKKLDLRPVMTLESQVSAIKHFTKGQAVGYGRTWIAKEDTDIAVLPIGYGDGLLRHFAKNGLKIAIKGKNYPVVGRICMDQCMVDIGPDNKSVKRWDKAIVFGSTEDGALQNAEDLARANKTISYEFTTVLTRRVPRFFIGG